MNPMTSPAFDTLKAAKVLQAAGFDDAQAEAVIATADDAVGGNIATKADFQGLRAATRACHQGLKAAIQHFELRMDLNFEILYKHLWAMSIGIVAAVVALMKLLS